MYFSDLCGLHLASRLWSTNSSSANRNENRKDLDTPRSRLQVQFSVPVSQEPALCIDSHTLLMPLWVTLSRSRPFVPGDARLRAAGSSRDASA